MKRNPLTGVDHEVFLNAMQALTDGARAHWFLFLGKHGMGAIVYKQLPGQSLEFVAGLESYFLGSLFEGADGHLYHLGSDVNGNLSISEAIPGWTSTRSAH